MRLLDRQDTVLLVGLTTALIVVFAKPIRYLLDGAREVEDTYGLALVPALIILTVVFLFHQQAKRQEMNAQAATSAAEARQERERAEELEQLVVFGQALARALDMDALREALRRHLPRVIGDADAWVLVRGDNKWERLAGDAAADGLPSEQALETLAERTLSQGSATEPGGGTPSDGVICFPLIVGDSAVGVLGVVVDADTIPAHRWQVLAAAAALLAIAVGNAQLFRETREHGMYDGLTGCFNHTHAMEMLDTELRRARRSQLPLSTIMFDLDHFKAINDRFGHLCGDAVLAAVGRRLKELLRDSDVRCRYGGEEFLVLLPDTPLRGAVQVAEWLRQEIAGISVQWGEAAVPFTASFGVGAAVVGEPDAKSLIARADAALYRAKGDGRNCVRVEEGAAAELAAEDVGDHLPVERRKAE